MIDSLLSPTLVEALGWTLLHTLWQGAVFALLLGVLLILTRKFSANARYVTAVGLLTCFFLAVGFTFYQTYARADRQELVAHPVEIAGGARVSNASVEPDATTSVAVTTTTEPTEKAAPTFRQRTVSYYNQHLPLIVTIWLLGVLVLQLRLLGQLAFIQRLKHYGTQRFPTSWAEKLAELETIMDVRKPIRYLTTYRTGSPLTVGWLRPVILFPAGLLESLREHQVAAILAHEIAHVKRHDFLVNLVQSILCSLFFYHPGVWWMSRRVEEEREHCCDDLAIRATGQAVGYAGTLVQLQEEAIGQRGLGMAFFGQGSNGFKTRIQRLLGGSLKRENYAEGFTSALLLFLSLGLSVLVSAQSPTPANQATDSEASALNILETTEEAAPFPPVTFDWEQPADNQPAPEPANEVVTEQPGPLAPDGSWTKGEELDLLIRAIFEGDLAVFDYFIDKVEDLNVSGGSQHHYFTPLMAAASENRLDMAKTLVQKGADVNFINQEGWTALIEAADEGAYEVAKFLIDSKADVNLRGGGYQRSAAAMAASEGHLDILRLLIQHGADFNPDGKGYSPLQLAAEEGQLAVVKALVEQGADLDYRGQNGITALGLAAEEGQTEVVRYLIAQGANLTAGDHSPLHLAAEDGHPRTVQLLLEKGAPIDLRDHDGKTALMRAAADDQDEVIRVLLAAGADPSLVDHNGHSAMGHAAEDDARRAMKAMTEGDIGEEALRHLRSSYEILHGPAEEGHLYMVEAMLKTGIDVNITDKSGRTALSKAAREGHLHVVDYLLQAGADPTAGREDPLYLAVLEGHVDVVEGLLTAGISFQKPYSFRDVRNWGEESGKTPLIDYRSASLLMVALSEEDGRMARVLLESGLDPNRSCRKFSFQLTEAGKRNKDIYRMPFDEMAKLLPLIRGEEEWTPLMEAVETGRIDLVKVLLTFGADPKRQSSSGLTALTLAQELGHDQVVSLLR